VAAADDEGMQIEGRKTKVVKPMCFKSACPDAKDLAF